MGRVIHDESSTVVKMEKELADLKDLAGRRHAYLETATEGHAGAAPRTEARIGGGLLGPPRLPTEAQGGQRPAALHGDLEGTRRPLLQNTQRVRWPEWHWQVGPVGGPGCEGGGRKGPRDRGKKPLPLSEWVDPPLQRRNSWNPLQTFSAPSLKFATSLARLPRMQRQRKQEGLLHHRLLRRQPRRRWGPQPCPLHRSTRRTSST